MISHKSIPSLNPLDKLQTALDVAYQQRDQAQADASKWRRRYEVEAQQRRQETAIAEETIHKLRLEIQQLSQLRPNYSTTPVLNPVPATQNLPASNSLEQLRTQLAQALAERDQLVQALDQEKTAHAKTREGLISALGDALRTQSKSRSRPPALPSSRAGARAGSIILKDRANRQT